MEALKLFERLAAQTYTHSINPVMPYELTKEILASVLAHEGEKLKSLLSGNTYLANESHIVNL